MSAEKVAINAVMAGCRPEHMPIVVAAVEGIADPRWGYHGPATSTGGAAVLMIVNGPIGGASASTAGDNLFGPGWRSNATVGRAVRLVMRNVIGTLPGLSTAARRPPGKYTYVIAENEAESPWTPLHVERGLPPERQRGDGDGRGGSAPVLQPALEHRRRASSTTLCDDMRITTARGPAPVRGGAGGRAHADDRGRTAGPRRTSEVRLREYPEQHRPLQAHGAAARVGDARRTRRPCEPLVAGPDDVLVVAAGGRAGAFSCYIPGWAEAGRRPRR